MQRKYFIILLSSSLAVELLTGLATIGSATLDLVPRHGLAECNINAGRRGEAEALGNLGEVELVHVVNGAKRVRGVCVKVRLEGLLGALLQVVVLADELLQLALDVLDLLGGELELDDGHTRCLEVRQEANLVGLQEQQTAASLVGASGGTTDAVNVVAGVVRRIELDDEVDFGDLRDGWLAIHVRVRATVKGNIHRDHERQRLCR